MSVPNVVVHAMESLNAENPDHVRGLFGVSLGEVQATLAIEDNLQDIRCALELM